MRHISEGTLRALYDDALSTEERARVRQHLTTCGQCAQRASIVQQRADHVYALLSELESEPGARPVMPQTAHSQLAAYRQMRKEQRMARNPFSRRYRPAWFVAALALLTVVTLTVPPIRTLAGDLLAVFRVESVAFTPVDVEAFPNEEILEDLAPEIERTFGESLGVVTEKEPADVTEAEARERADFPIRLPDTTEPTRHEWTPPIHISMEVDVSQIEALFTELGYEDVRLPQALEGRTVEADFSGMLTTYYGSCADASVGRDCITLVQMASPTASVPDGLDIEQLGRIYLELLGTPTEEARQLSEQIDWTTTLVLPFPHHVNLTHETLSIEGVEATLVHSESGYRPTEYLLTWVKGDVIYAVIGQGDSSEALSLAASLR